MTVPGNAPSRGTDQVVTMPGNAPSRSTGEVGAFFRASEDNPLAVAQVPP